MPVMCFESDLYVGVYNCDFELFIVSLLSFKIHVLIGNTEKNVCFLSLKLLCFRLLVTDLRKLRMHQIASFLSKVPWAHAHAP